MLKNYWEIESCYKLCATGKRVSVSGRPVRNLAILKFESLTNLIVAGN